MRRGEHARGFLRLLGVLILAVAVLPMTGASAQEGTPIDISTTLVEDHLGPIVITANDVVLDCDGHRIVAEDGGVGVLLEGLEGVSIRNCRIEGFEVGIMVSGSHSSTIEANTFTGNGNFSVFAADGSHSSVIRNNHIVGGTEGISLFGSEETNTYNNDVEGNKISGANECFQFRYMTNSRIVDNKASNCFTAGFSIGDFSFHNDIKHNLAFRNGTGVALFTGASGNLVSGNLLMWNVTGVVAGEWSSGSTIVENRFFHNTKFGFSAEFESEWNEVTENRFCQNGEGDWFNTEDSPTIYNENKVCGSGK